MERRGSRGRYEELELLEEELFSRLMMDEESKAMEGWLGVITRGRGRIKDECELETESLVGQFDKGG